MAVIVAVIVAVNAPVIVAALVNGNDIVAVIDAVDDQGSTSFVSMATMLCDQDMGNRSADIYSAPGPALKMVRVHGVDHGHGIVPVPERGHDHGRAHVHGHDHANVHLTGFDRPF